MTITEIENILQTLKSRHPQLDEATLTTLLVAGGWEEKVKQEALLLFKSSLLSKNVKTTTVGVNTSSDDKQEEPIVEVQQKKVEVVAEFKQFPQKKQVDVLIEKPQIHTDSVTISDTENHAEKMEQVIQNEHENEHKNKYTESLTSSFIEPLAQTAPQTAPQSQDVKVEILQKEKEPQSLLETKIVPRSKEIEPPLNLPTKPFESTVHIVPFAQYKELYHTDSNNVAIGEKINVTPESVVVTQVKPQIKQVIENGVMENQPPAVLVYHDAPHKPPKQVIFTRTTFDGEDEGLILMTGTMLLLILLLLAYMYTNGRL